MLATIIQDTYSPDETEEVVDALDDLCSPDDSYGWSSAAVYSFWDTTTKEVLYVGLAVDLPQRFRRHNGLAGTSSTGCKYNEIQKHFGRCSRLGYSIFVQSAMSQPLSSRALTRFENPKAMKDEMAATMAQGQHDIARWETLLIEEHRTQEDSLPRWNKISGKKLSYSATVTSVLNGLVDAQSNFLVARCSLQEMSADPTKETYEQYLHAARFSALYHSMSPHDALNLHEKFAIVGGRDRVPREIRETRYLEREPNVNL